MEHKIIKVELDHNLEIGLSVVLKPTAILMHMIG